MATHTDASLERAMDERAAADFLNVSVKTVQGWRLKRAGPRYHKLGGRVRYLPEDLRRFLDACAVDPVNSGGRE
jgi:hypothetical protein